MEKYFYYVTEEVYTPLATTLTIAELTVRVDGRHVQRRRREHCTGQQRIARRVEQRRQ